MIFKVIELFVLFVFQEKYNLSWNFNKLNLMVEVHTRKKVYLFFCTLSKVMLFFKASVDPKSCLPLN